MFILQARNTCVCGTRAHKTIEQVAQFDLVETLVETSDFPSRLWYLLLESCGSLPPDIRYRT